MSHSAEKTTCLGGRERDPAAPALAPLPVPSFYCPLEPRCGPDADRLDEESIAWMDRLGVYADREQRDYIARMKIGHFAALTIPEGRTARRQIYSDLITWVFAFDDAVFDEPRADTTPSEARRIILDLARTLDAPHDAASANLSWHTLAIRNILTRLEHVASSDQIRRLVDAVRKYLLGAALTTDYLFGQERRRHDVPSINEYTKNRLGDGTVATWGLIPIVGDYGLSPAELDDPRVRALEEITDVLTMWDNDIFGYNKELYRSTRYGYPLKNNLLTVVAHEHKCSPQLALAEAVAMRDRVMVLCLELGRQVARHASPELRRYVAGLRQWNRGYLEWSFFVTDRFSRLGNPDDATPADMFARPTMAEQPLDGSLEPLPIPMIAWWWGQLAPH